MNITITAETKYWIAFQCDTTVSATNLNYSSASNIWEYDAGATTTLPDPSWTANTRLSNYNIGVYAVWSAGGGGGTILPQITNAYMKDSA